MTIQAHPLLLILLFPAIGAITICALNDKKHSLIRLVASVSSAIPLLVALYLSATFQAPSEGYAHELIIPWIRLPAINVNFHVGLDGINTALVLLHSFCAFSGVLISRAIKERVKEYYVFYLLLITGVFGVFLSLDLFFFYLFYEMAVIPMYPLIGIWGSDVKEGSVVRYSKEYATMKLTLYLTLGAVIALIGLLWLYASSGARTFDIADLARHLRTQPLPSSLQICLFPLLAVGFGVIAPIWPLHSWSPIGHAAAPSAVSMLHAGVLMKLGSYAIIRLAIGLLPDGARMWLPWIATICIMNIIYGGFVAMAQKDLKLIIGYSSSSHMGYVLLGIACLTPLSLGGAVMLMFAHGIMTALAFALVGHVYDETHTRYLPDLGGLAGQLPFIATCGVIAAMASSGLPGFANFVAELLIFIGGWDLYPLQVILAVFGVVITSVYMLRFVRGVFFGEKKASFAHVRDATLPLSRAPYAILIGVLLVVGCWPKPLLSIIDSGARSFIEKLEAAPHNVFPNTVLTSSTQQIEPQKASIVSISPYANQ